MATEDSRIIIINVGLWAGEASRRQQCWVVTSSGSSPSRSAISPFLPFATLTSMCSNTGRSVFCRDINDGAFGLPSHLGFGGFGSSSSAFFRSRATAAS